MSSPDEIDDALSKKHTELCAKLDVDVDAAKRSWESFSGIRMNYTLDGDELHWLSCALYVACKTSVTPTVKSGGKLEGNCVSLTKLLRLCNISLIQFFNKIKKWMEMSSMSEDFRLRIERLERKFAVSTVLYQKFKPIFEDIFTSPTSEPTRSNTKQNRKQKLVSCTSNSLFEFAWCLFICVKGEFHNSADDLVDMYHVLLACIDFVYGNAFMSLRKDLINPTFSGLPSDWNSDEFTVPNETPCIISLLCKTHEGLPLEAATTKQYSWRPVITSFFNKGILRGDSNLLIGLLDQQNFDVNLKSLNNLYETYVLSVGEFDERIFLGEHSNSESSTSNKINGDELSKAIAKFGMSGRSVAPDTPLTGRRYLRARVEPLTPVSSATQSIAKLQAYLQGCKPQPSIKLKGLFIDSGVSEETINNCVVEPCKQWTDKFIQTYWSVGSSETAKARANMAATLHFKILEHILKEEKRKKPQVPLQSLVSQELFQRTLFACCAEIILASYGAHSVRFPRILECLELSAFHFYKIIELVVQAVMDKLSRDIVKHLNAIEEQALESLVWVSASPIWECLSNTTVPASTHVYPNEARSRQSCSLQSPVSSATDRFISPSADQAKKQLFKDHEIKPGQSLLTLQQQSDDTEISESQIKLTDGAGDKMHVETSSGTDSGGQKQGSLVLFFRKFYSLAVVRMNDLCLRLRLTDSELKKKIWTCLEYSIMHQTHLLKDRHLDQILMCAVYVICKVSHKADNPVERTFTEIMRCYRLQPQADNHVYRSVLIPSDNVHEQAERGDLIKFYNKVYVKCMQNFAMRFTGRQRDECSLSPLPAGRGEVCSPGSRCVSERHRLYVSSLSASPVSHTPQMTYHFSRSPAKDLKAINHMLASEPRRKRPSSSHNAPAVARKLQCLITDRQAV